MDLDLGCFIPEPCRAFIGILTFSERRPCVRQNFYLVTFPPQLVISGNVTLLAPGDNRLASVEKHLSPLWALLVLAPSGLIFPSLPVRADGGPAFSLVHLPFGRLGLGSGQLCTGRERRLCFRACRVAAAHQWSGPGRRAVCGLPPCLSEVSEPRVHVNWSS